MKIFEYMLLAFLVLCAVSVSFSKNLLNSILIFMSFSLIMSIMWILLQSPDLAITEAAVGAGVTTILFFATFEKDSWHGSGSRSGWRRSGRKKT